MYVYRSIFETFFWIFAPEVSSYRCIFVLASSLLVRSLSVPYAPKFSSIFQHFYRLSCHTPRSVDLRWHTRTFPFYNNRRGALRQSTIHFPPRRFICLCIFAILPYTSFCTSTQDFLHPSLLVVLSKYLPPLQVLLTLTSPGHVLYATLFRGRSSTVYEARMAPLISGSSPRFQSTILAPATDGASFQPLAG